MAARCSVCKFSHLRRCRVRCLDHRVQRLLTAELHHFFKDEANLLAIDVSRSAGSVRGWTPLILGDVRMIERSKDLRFPSEPGDTIGIVREGRRQELQRDVPTELRVLGVVDLAHAAAANQRQDFVSAEAGAGTERHGLLESPDYARTGFSRA